MSDIPKVKELFPISTGVITHINYDFNVITAPELDILFIANYGERSISPLISHLVNGIIPTDDELTNIASIIKTYYFVKWERLKKLYLLEYDPIHNYLDELTETIKGTDKENVQKNSTVTTDMSQDGTVNNTRTDNLSDIQVLKVESSDKNDSEDSVYGFNSSDGVKSDSGIETVISTESTNDSRTNTGTQNNTNISKNTNSGTVQQSNIIATDDNKEQTRTSKHAGNIGNLTTQQLFNQELELRKWNFINSVLEDIKELLTLPIYM